MLLRIWDLLFYQGSLVLFQVTLGMLKIKEEELVASENSASIFNTLSDLPSQLVDGPAVLGEAMRLAGALSQDTLEAQRHKHLAYILNEQAQLSTGNGHQGNANLNKVCVGHLVVPVCVGYCPCNLDVCVCVCVQCHHVFISQTLLSKAMP